jgi:murein DD-endopeptidase MepM/ murein hydrolase activator NlpD
MVVADMSAQQPQFSPGFPIRGLQPFSPQIINSVFDLASGLGANAPDKKVRAYTGEEGDAGFGVSGGDCYKGNAAGTAFLLSGNYRGSGGNQQFLCYDGHDGVDFKADGDAVIAVADGVVWAEISDRPDRAAGTPLPQPPCNCYGNVIHIDHGNGFRSVYGHLKKDSLVSGRTGRVLQVGDVVLRGEQIAISGNSGDSSNPHLHFEIRRYETKIEKGTKIDPYAVWAPAHNFSFALDSLRVDGNVANSGQRNGIDDFVDNFDDGSLSSFPTSNFGFSGGPAQMNESSGFLQLRSSDGANLSEEQERRLVFLSDSAFLGGQFSLQDGAGSSTVIASFRPDVPLQSQAYGLFIYTNGVRESVSLQIGNDGAGTRIAGVVFINGVAEPTNTFTSLNLNGVSRILLKLDFNDNTNRVSGFFSTNGGTTFTPVPLNSPGTVLTTGSGGVQVFGSVFVRRF